MFPVVPVWGVGRGTWTGDPGSGPASAVRFAPVTDVSDEELERQAMSADPNPQIDADASPFLITDPDQGLLPEWYMPVPQATGRRPRHVIGAVTIIVGLLVVNGAGLCVTYGLPEIAW